MSITPKAIQDPLDELEASKQSRLRDWNVLQRLRVVLSETGNVAIPPPAQKTFDAEGEILEHALTKSFRIRNEAIGTPIQRRYHQGRMQIRLSARPSGTLESVGSGRGSDSELSPCADDTEGRLQKKNLLAAIISGFHRNGICRSVGTLRQHRMSLRSGSIQRQSKEAWML
jgi:hypothetical protein